MAVLKAAARNKLPTSSFAGPERSFPINDRVHAEKAIQLAPRSFHAGNISHAQMVSIQARARKKLGTKTLAEDMAR